ncbi:winged helix-turn-helix domain-containing protein [Dermacoccaceae bacterium W4C1]
MAIEDNSWRVLAHPLRSRILAHLRLHGGSTSAELARALDTHTGATSYHVRVLAEAGLVEDTGLGNAKTRIWAATDRDGDDGSDLQAQQADPALDGEAAEMDDWLAHDYLDHFARRGHDWVRDRHRFPPVFQDECGLHDDPVLVSEEQLAALRAELDAVLARYRRIGAGTPGARRVAAYTALVPVDPPASG